MPLSHTPLRAANFLIDAVQAISVARSIADIAVIVKQTARQGVGADGATFVLREGDLCHYLDEDAIGPLWKGRRFPMEACVSGWAMIHGRPAVIPDIYVDPRIPVDAYRPTFVKSLVMVPIRCRESLGSIGVYWARTESPSDLTVQWLQALADATSAGIEAVRAQNESERWKKASDQTGLPSGIVRMCAWTRRLFHNGEWLSVEAYLQARFGVAITHGMSEEAMNKFLADAGVLDAGFANE